MKIELICVNANFRRDRIDLRTYHQWRQVSMIKKYFIYSFLLFICLPFEFFSQKSIEKGNSTTFVSESILIHTDRQIYISGETIWFQIYSFETNKTRLFSF